ncbi:MAG: adenylate cyclase, partial [Acetobacteraceae bacterium]|nr:adenylate cyclase [Acetobacteraceae bacterium]
ICGVGNPLSAQSLRSPSEVWQIGLSRTGRAALNSPGRKLIAVLYADMVGYGRLIGLDDAGTAERLRTLRSVLIDPAVHEHGGRIVQTGGDSLLIVFDSIDGAVRCAVKVQHQVSVYDGDQPPDRAIRFRVGINIGDAIADGTDLHGDAVNVAVRLQAECPPGGVCVSRSVRDHVHGQFDLDFRELGALRLKNITRPVEAFVVRPATGTGPSSASAISSPFNDLSLADRPSIAVLAFTNMSGDPEQDYFSDGMVGEIITALSRIRWLFVIARNSSFTYKGQAVDVKQIGRELGVRYVLEGSVRKAGHRVSITAQLIHTLTGAHLWADRFDGSLEDVFDLQDKVASSVAGVIEPALLAAEARGSNNRPTNDLSAYNLYLRSYPMLWSSA